MTEVVQVVMIDVVFERFKDWLDREVDAEVFMIPSTDGEDLPTYGVRPRRFGPEEV